MMVSGRERHERREDPTHSTAVAPILIAVIIFLSAAVGASLARRMDAPDFPTISTPAFPTCEKGDAGAKGEKGDAGAKGEKGDAGQFRIVPKRTQDAPNLAWLCPLCTCAGPNGPNGPTGLCDAIHARATKIITNFHAACALCAESETAESILESVKAVKADVFFFDVGYPFRAVDTCGEKPVHSCVLCDNVTGVEPNCGVDNLGKMRDLRVTAGRDMACRTGKHNEQQCACSHAEILTPVSWSECAAIVNRNRESPNEHNMHDPTSVRYLGYVYNPSSNGAEGQSLKPGESSHMCTNKGRACRPARFSVSQFSAANDALGNISVAAAIAKFYGSDKDAAGHAAIKAICRARGAGTTCGGLTGLTGLTGLMPRAVQTSIMRGMLVPFAPITEEANWIEPVTLFSV